MKRHTPIIAIIVIAALVLAGIIGYSALHKQSNSSEMSTMSMDHSSQMSTMSMPDTSKAEATNTVSIDNFMFSPSAITVKKGTTVTWTNIDGVDHTVTSLDSSEKFDSKSIAKNGTFTHTFSTAGTFHYECDIHPSMKGTVVVTE